MLQSLELLLCCFQSGLLFIKSLQVICPSLHLQINSINTFVEPTLSLLYLIRDEFMGINPVFLKFFIHTLADLTKHFLPYLSLFRALIGPHRTNLALQVFNNAQFLGEQLLKISFSNELVSLCFHVILVSGVLGYILQIIIRSFGEKLSLDSFHLSKHSC